MQQIPLVDLNQKGRSSNVTACRTINLYPHILSGNEVVLYGTPGLQSMGYSTYGDRVRGMIIINGVKYFSQGSNFCRVNNGNVEVLGTHTSGGTRVQMEYNGFQIALLVDRRLWLFDMASNALTAYSGAGFPDLTSLVYLNGYFVGTVAGTQQFRWSALYDGTSWPALNFASAETSPTGLIGAVVNRGELYLVGSTNIEVWYNSGGSEVFAKQQGATVQKGVGALYTCKVIDNAIIFLGANGILYRLDGYTPIRISNDALEYEISRMTDFSDAYANVYVQEGHEFYCLSFPTYGQTWAFDAATQQLHQRMTNDIEWRPFVIVQDGANVFAGARDSGQIFRVDMNVFTDNLEPIKRSHVLPVIKDNLERIRHSRLEIEMESGVGDTLGNRPLTWLDWSDDGGHRWSNRITAGFGKIGGYLIRVYWQKLGMARQRFYRIGISDPVKVVIIAAYADTAGGAY